MKQRDEQAMTDEPETPSEEFMSALVTEHFALQSARGTLTAESASRAALYLASVTGSLIALGFVANNHAAVLPFAVAIIPALLILGEFTYWRLVMNGVEDLHHSYEIQAIRAYYRRFVPLGLSFFATSTLWKSAPPPREFMGTTARDLGVLLTASSMVAAINGIVAGAGAAFAAQAWANASPSRAIALAVVVAVVLFVVHARLAIRQYKVGLADLAD